MDCADDHINPICSEKFSNLEDGVGQVLATQSEHTTVLKNIHDRLFVDNGRISVQTKLNRFDWFMKVHLWVYGIICSGTILTTVGILITNAIKK